jgi:hypothetical protein
LPLASASADRIVDRSARDPRIVPYRTSGIGGDGRPGQGLPVDGLPTDGSILSPRGTPTVHRASLVTPSNLFLLHFVYHAYRSVAIAASPQHNARSFLFVSEFSAARATDCDGDGDVRVCFRGCHKGREIDYLYTGNPNAIFDMARAKGESGEGKMCRISTRRVPIARADSNTVRRRQFWKRIVNIILLGPPSRPFRKTSMS